MITRPILKTSTCGRPEMVLVFDELNWLRFPILMSLTGHVVLVLDELESWVVAEPESYVSELTAACEAAGTAASASVAAAAAMMVRILVFIMLVSPVCGWV